MKPIAYIHIGLEKTGTTTLQEFFYLNRETLQKDNIYYPSSPGARNHTDLAAYAFDKTLGDLIIQKNIQTDELKQAFRTAFKKSFDSEITALNKKQNLLVSCEHLSSRVFSKDEIRKLLSLFTELGYLPKVIVYLRRQDQYLLSTYSTWLKCGATAELNKNAYKRKRYDYLTLLEMWGELLEVENLIVKIFEKNRMYKNDLIQDFLKILNVTNTEKYLSPPNDLNKSLDKTKLSFLKTMNGLVPEHLDGHKNPLRGDLITALENIDNNEKLRLPAELAKEILAYYKNDNLAIKAKYFPLLEDPLFAENIAPTDNQEANLDHLNTKDLYTITSALWTYQQEEINKLKKAWQDQRQQLNELSANQQ